MNDKLYFVCDPAGKGIAFFYSLEEAEKTFKEVIDSYAKDAKKNLKWVECVNQLCIGNVLRQCVVVPHSVDVDGKQIAKIVSINYGDRDE